MFARAAFTNTGIAWAYGRAIASGLASRVVAGISSMAMLWLLNAILGKEGFAHCMIGLALNQTVALIVVSGFETTLFYHVSRLNHVTEDTRSRRLAGAALCGAACIAIILATIVVTFADAIAEWMGEPAVGSWIRIFAPIVPLGVIHAVQTGWIRARQMVPMSVFFEEVLPNILRVVLLGLVWLLAGNAFGVGGAVAVALLIPIIWLFNLQPTTLVSPLNVFTKWDVRYGLTVVLTRLADQRAQSISVLIVGILATAETTAEFVLAVRFALLLGVLQHVVNLLLVPRLGALMARASADDLLKEYDTTRFVGLLGAIAGSIAYLLFLPFILPLFGDYGAAYPVLIILNAGMIVRTAFGSSGSYLVMSGYAGWRLVNSVGSLVVMTAMCYLLVPPLAGEGAAMATLLSIVFMNGVSAIVIWRLDKLATVTANLLWAMALSSVLLVAAGFGLVPPLVAAACLSFIGGWVLFFYRGMWRPWLRMLPGRKNAA